jgi:DNA primase
MAAAARAIDRALPRLRPGRSFRFAAVAGGKDPDDILREQGAAALKAQLAETTPFVDALFRRERDLAPLDTPERRADLRRRLRLATQAIEDPDLAREYRRSLETAFGQLFASPGPVIRPASAYPVAGKRRWKDNAGPFLAPATAEGRAGARRLAAALSAIPAALARWAVHDPPVLDDHLEDLEACGFGDPALAELASAIVRVRLSAERLDTDSLQRHLAGSGFSELLSDIDRAAAHSGAPFMKPDVTLTTARSQWSRAFEAMCRLAALEEALTAARQDLVAGGDSKAHRTVKVERDRLRRAVETGAIWSDEESA